MSETAIERRRTAALEAVLGTGDMAQMLEATRRNVETAIEFARERNYVTEYPIERNGKRVGTRLWFHHPTWQLLGQSFGITAYTDGEPVETKPGTWQAAAIAALIENGRTVGRAVGICSRGEPGKARMADHHLSATAQTRAQRNALRSCLGAILVAAGYEISDPEAKLTNDQLGTLHALEHGLGLSHDEGHARAGVESYRDLTREQASELIEAWASELDEISAPAVGAGDNPEGASGSEVTLHGAAPASDPASGGHVHQWAPAPRESLARKGWRVCTVEGCGRTLGPGEADERSSDGVGVA